jgi:hypothetical protein
VYKPPKKKSLIQKMGFGPKELPLEIFPLHEPTNLVLQSSLKKLKGDFDEAITLNVALTDVSRNLKQSKIQTHILKF